jgi:hypothetical protein
MRRDPVSTKKTDQAGPLGVVFTMPGAPETPHIITGVRGVYRPGVPTPIGGEGELSLEEVNAAIANGAPLEIVKIPKGELDDARARVSEDLMAARTGAVEARNEDLVGAEAGTLTDHIEAVKE